MLITALSLIVFGLFLIASGVAVFAVFHEDCIQHGPGKPWQYVLCPVGMVLALLGALITYHTVRVFIL